MSIIWFYHSTELHTTKTTTKIKQLLIKNNESIIIDTELKILYRNQEDFFFLIITAGLAQSVERLTAGQHVVGSIPGTGPIGSKKGTVFALCLLLVERAKRERA